MRVPGTELRAHGQVPKALIPATPRTCVALKEDMAMRTNTDFAPFFRSTVGFDRLFDLLENTSRLTTASNWPAYNIARTGEDGYRISPDQPSLLLANALRHQIR